MEKDQNYYRLPKAPKLVIDIGGNIGCISILCAEKGAEVFAYEPASDNFETLKHNIEINGYAEKVHCIKKAVGKPGMEKLYIHPRNSGANNIQHCDLLKLDCEGAEKDIIADLDDELASKIDQISLEYHGDRHERDRLAKILSKWYTEEHIRRYEFVYKKRV